MKNANITHFFIAPKLSVYFNVIQWYPDTYSNDITHVESVSSAINDFISN